MTRFMMPLLGGLVLTGCVSTDRCPEGTGRIIGPNGRVMGDCIVPDGAVLDGAVLDGGPRDARIEEDAGPCGGTCAGSTPLCRESDAQCVACLGDRDCGGATSRCDVAAGACVECLGAEDCGADEPVCTGGVCGPCAGDDDCEGRAGTPACRLDMGACVACTAMNRSACGLNVCDASTNTCTDRPAGMRGLCQECVADDECMTGQLCVPMTFMGTDTGRFCLWRQDATEGPGGACVNVPPYAATREVTSVDGITTNVCSLALTTCEALNEFRMQSCTVGMPPAAATNSECGVAGLDDGLCRVRDVGVNRCTIPCLSNDDCLPGSTCNTGATPRYCDF